MSGDGRLVQPVTEGAEILSLLEVGWSVWERQADPDVETIHGGIVVEIKDRPLEQARGFVCLEWHHGQPKFTELLDVDVDPALCQLPDSAAIRSQARRLQSLAGRRKGSVDPFELRLSKTALLLLEVIA